MANDAPELARYLLSLTPRERAELLHTTRLTEAAASAALAKKKTNG